MERNFRHCRTGHEDSLDKEERQYLDYLMNINPNGPGKYVITTLSKDEWETILDLRSSKRIQKEWDKHMGL